MGTLELTILIFAGVMTGLDALTNLFLLMYAPKWSVMQQDKIKELRKQNRELKDFIALYTGETDETDNRGNDRAVEE